MLVGKLPQATIVEFPSNDGERLEYAAWSLLTTTIPQVPAEYLPGVG